MNKITQKIEGNNNIQVAGDWIKTEKIVKTTEVIYHPDNYISDTQAKEIRDRVQKLAKELSGDTKSKFPYATAYKRLYDQYHITKYTLLPKELYDKAVKWLDKQIAMNRPKLKNSDYEEYIKDMYKVIHTRARQVEKDVHEFAYTSLGLKKPITSITELSDKQLEKLNDNLYNIIPKKKKKS
jgi:hypothetical protein